MNYILTLILFFLLALTSESQELDNEWLNLVHYEKSGSNSYYSLIDDPKFFLAKDGHSNPRTELEANLTTLQTNPQEYFCKFPARFRYLSKTTFLNFSINEDCLAEWKKDLAPKGITVVFPSESLNNPASMFGHTLLRIDSDQALYSYGVNFSADTLDKNGLSYAIKGIFGGYKGRFSIAPYFKILEAYQDIEKRGVWEFPLQVTDERLNIFIEHLWELRSTFSWYYFFDRNCSSMMTSLLKVLDPSYNIDQTLVSIPLDTLKKLKLCKHEYRESLTENLNRRYKNLTPQEKNDFSKIINGDYKESQSTKLLELAYDYLNYLNKKGKNTAVKALDLLSYRSKLPISEKENFQNTKPSPTEGHESSKIKVGYLLDQGLSLELRPAYHTFLDPEYAYDKYSSFEFFKISGIFGKEIKLENATILKIRSITPYGNLANSFAWGVDVLHEDVNQNFVYGGFAEEYQNLNFYGLVGPGFTGSQIEGKAEISIIYRSENFNSSITYQRSELTNKLEVGIVKPINKNQTVNFDYSLKNDENLFKFSFSQYF